MGLPVYGVIAAWALLCDAPPALLDAAVLLAAGAEVALELLELELELLPQPAMTIAVEIQAAAAARFHLLRILFLSLVYDVVVPRDSCARVQMCSCRVMAHPCELD